MIEKLNILAPDQGLCEITAEVDTVVRAAMHELAGERSAQADRSDGSGLCTLFVKHTSASLTIQENADPSARRDLEAWLNRLVPENDPLYTHTAEGPDDMPSHIKAILTSTSLTIPIENGGLVLGTWQGIYLWEHRRPPKRREIVVHIVA